MVSDTKATVSDTGEIVSDTRTGSDVWKWCLTP
jgi:hypothetical protein